MKIGAAWYGFRYQSPANYFEMVASLGLKYVEIPLYGQVLSDSNWTYHSPQGVEALLTSAQQAGVRIVSGVSNYNIAGTLRSNTIDRGGVELGLAAARRAIEIGESLGITVLRLAEPQRLESHQRHLEQSYMYAYAQAFQCLGDHAEEHHMRVAIENFGLTPDQINHVLVTADHPAVGTLYDPCNYYRHGIDPVYALKVLRDRIYYCHLKDAFFPYPHTTPESIIRELMRKGYGNVPPWWWIRPLGQGNVDWEPILSELASSYKGYACLEHDVAENVMYGTRTSIEYIRQIIEKRNLNIEI